MVMSVLILYHLFHEILQFLQKLRSEILCINTIGANIVKYQNLSILLQLPKKKFIVYDTHPALFTCSRNLSSYLRSFKWFKVFLLRVRTS